MTLMGLVSGERNDGGWQRTTGVAARETPEAITQDTLVGLGANGLGRETIYRVD